MAILFNRAGEYPYGCFSNFSLHPVTVDGATWPTSEHYYQAMKFPHDAKRQKRIRNTEKPGHAKRIAWEEGVRIRRGWDSVRNEVMLTVLRAKFTQHPDLREILLATGDEKIVEHTHRDPYWGDGGDGSGKNMLGRLLMRVRSELREEADES